MKKILFVTTSNLSANPRLWKELKLFSPIYSCVVICFTLNDSSIAADVLIEKSIPSVDIQKIKAGKWAGFSWLFASAIHKVSALISRLPLKLLMIRSMSIDKKTFLLGFHLRKIKRNEYDLIVGHNIGSLYPIYKISKRTATPFLFDLEDWHPGEHSNSQSEKYNKSLIMREILPYAIALTSASPFYLDRIESELKISLEKFAFSECILNSFSQSEFTFIESKADKSKLNLVWFSQNISEGRGLELFIPVLYQFKDRLTITLVGKLSSGFYQNFLKQYIDVIKIVEPMAHSDLNQFICGFDVGLAIEISSRDVNKDLAISNKIFSYIQAGLYVLATDTSGHKWILDKYPMHGTLVKQNNDAVYSTVKSLLSETLVIRENKKSRYSEALNLNWEVESPKLKNSYFKVLN